ncbi:MAG: hypothetical protein JW779_08060 [Candidatus Thorarchaeota archaeon]|nr:hypothetical protein [Candidatus Thorarchaeota archaeon]
MGDTEIICPHCNSTKFKVSSDKNKDEFKNLKGGNWQPLLTKIGQDQWSEDPNHGIAVRCKCGKGFFVYDFKADAPAQISTAMRENQMVSTFCQKCGSAFVSTNLTCPGCGQQY